MYIRENPPYFTNSWRDESLKMRKIIVWVEVGEEEGEREREREKEREREGGGRERERGREGEEAGKIILYFY